MGEQISEALDCFECGRRYAPAEVFCPVDQTSRRKSRLFRDRVRRNGRLLLPELHELEDLRGLTLQQPWLWSITDLAPGECKDVENRPIRPPHSQVGCWIALHAGLIYDAAGAVSIREICGEFAPPVESLPRGAITCLVKLTGFGRNEDFTGSNRSRWMFGPWCYLLGTPVVLPEPIRCRGMNGFWRVPSDALLRVRQGVQERREDARG